jgi:serine phosphatase RsbU (regulator of sigma subunit)
MAEVTNPAGEEWGNIRLVETVEANCRRTAREIVSQVMAEADAFARGAPQNDDMTLWVARVDAAEAGSVADAGELPSRKAFAAG